MFSASDFSLKITLNSEFEPPTPCVGGDIGENIRKIRWGKSTSKNVKFPKILSSLKSA